MDQGFQQLTLLIGHLKLGDENGQLILSLLGHLQLYIGSLTPVLTLPFSRYQRVIEPTWITSLWPFTSESHITVDVEHQWLPSLAHVGDLAIMDLVHTMNFMPIQCNSIYQCRIYLQVLLLLDITTADDKRLLLEYISGYCSTDRISTLEWPNSC